MLSSRAAFRGPVVFGNTGEKRRKFYGFLITCSDLQNHDRACAGYFQAATRERTDMDIIALASQKGSSGKTTIAGHLAVAAEHAGFGPVALMDTDPQDGLSDWWNARARTAARVGRAIDVVAPFDSHGAAIRFRAIVVPLSTSQTRIDFLLCQIESLTGDKSSSTVVDGRRL
jgi:hypothetical protein